MQDKKHKLKSKKRLSNQSTVYTLSILLATSILSTTAFAAVDTMRLDKTLSSHALIRADALMRKNDFNAAYQLLEPLEPENAGKLEYDYLFGIAAVESSNITRGTFALERVLAVAPNHKEARTEIAKAHFLLGEVEASKAEFNNVLQEKPDEKTKLAVEKLLAAIDKAQGTGTSFSAYLDAGLGRDSNVSSAPNLQSISVPAFGGLVVQLDKNSREKSDNFMNFATGMSFRHTLTKQLSAFGGLGINGRRNADQSTFNNSAVDVNLGLQYLHNQHYFSVALQDSHFYLDSERFRHAYGATAQWLYNFDAFNQAGLYTQFSRLDYAGNSNINADRKIIGINVAHAFQSDFSPVVYGSIYGGREDARDSKMDFLSQDVLGLRAGGQVSFSDKWQLSASMSIEQRDNDENNSFFLKKREDNQYDASLGLIYVPTTSWTIKPQISYTKNDSNIDLYAYERSIVSVNVRKDFSW